jgi:hypothetical protein
MHLGRDNRASSGIKTSLFAQKVYHARSEGALVPQKSSHLQHQFRGKFVLSAKYVRIKEAASLS